MSKDRRPRLQLLTEPVPFFRAFQRRPDGGHEVAVVTRDTLRTIRMWQLVGWGGIGACLLCMLLVLVLNGWGDPFLWLGGVGLSAGVVLQIMLRYVVKTVIARDRTFVLFEESGVIEVWSGPQERLGGKPCRYGASQSRLEFRRADLEVIGRRRMPWRGYALVWHVGESEIAMACGKQREEIEEYVGQLPPALRGLEMVAGPVIKEVVDLRVWGSSRSLSG